MNIHRKFLLLIALGLTVNLVCSQSSTITNTSVQQRTDGSGMVDVYFTLNGSASSYNVLLEASFNGGSTYAPIPSQYLSGDISGISPGNRHIVWDGLGSFPNAYSTQAKLKITATPGGDWPTDTETEVVEVFNPATGKIWMDRNLGASRAATASNDAEAYGHLYQWGRAADGHQLRTSPTTSTLSNSDTPGHGNFITPESIDWRSPPNHNLWQGITGTNNPCPGGYRIPTQAEFHEELLSWSASNASGAFASPLKFPLPGARQGPNGQILYVGSIGGYWSSTAFSNYSMVLEIQSNQADANSPGERAFGASVRCIKDSNNSNYSLDLEVFPSGSGQVSGAGSYGQGAKINIGADNFFGYHFVRWTGDIEHIPNAYSPYTILTMPDHNVLIIANFERQNFDNQTAIVEVLNPATGKTWMDRNLGANRSATSSTDAEAYGHLYQWGRAADGHQLRTSMTIDDLITIEGSTHEYFVLTNISPYDWRSPQNDNLWQGENGRNNPCPIGYRLPSHAELNEERLSWSSNDATGAFNSPLKLPFGGFRHNANGFLYNIDTSGNYWTSTVYNTNSVRLVFGSTSTGMGITYRAAGSSVRCIKD